MRNVALKIWSRLLVLGAQALVCLVLLEVACQAYYFIVVVDQLEAGRNSDSFYYTRSDNPDLTYELKRGLDIRTSDRRLHVNQRGIREDSEEAFTDRIRIGILGDSATFGTGLSQDNTLSAGLQRLLDPRGATIKAFNFGVPGYGLQEMPAWMRQVVKEYRPNSILYLLNMNDFSLRDSIYEGADNGLYRSFKPPTLVFPFLVRKAIYRYYKEGQFSSVAWYKWLFHGNRSWALERISQMNDYARQNGVRFAVAILPPGVAYTADGHLLSAEQAQIMSFLRKSNIPAVDLTALLSADDFDETDHLTSAGASRAAQVLAGPIRSFLIAPGP